MCNGVDLIFLEVEKLSGRRHVEVNERRTPTDWTRWTRGMLQKRYAEAEQARVLPKHLEVHYTHKLGSRLHMAEIELIAMYGRCLDRRFPDLDTMRRAIQSWEQDRNHRQAKVDWQFTTPYARVKPRILYPKFYMIQNSKSAHS